MSFWIHTEGYFSERPHPGPFWIEVDGDKIGEIRTEAPSIDGAEIAKAAFLLPLLSDTHAHVYMSPWPLNPDNRSKPGSGPIEDEARAATARLQGALAKGVGFVRDMGDPLGINLAVKRHALGSAEHFPAYQVPGPAIHRPKKYGRFLGVKRETMSEIHSLIDELVELYSIDFIKVVSTGIVDFATRQVKQAPQYTGQELGEVVSHATALGLKVASHCSGQEGIENNIEGSIQFVEHAYFVRQDQRRRMRDQGQCWTPTFAPVYQQAVNADCGWDHACKQSLDAILRDHNEAVQQGYSEGNKILAGTDAGSPGVDIGDGLFIELRCLAKSLPLVDVLKIATASNADACGHPQYTGRIETGHPASFAIYSKAPWLEISQLGNPSQVYQHGECIHSFTLKDA